jgi:tellurite resistance protein TehA-like permease
VSSRLDRLVVLGHRLGPVAMATGIVSIAFRLAGRDVPSAVLFAAAACACVLLAAAVAAHAAGRRGPAPADHALSTVAATAVLATRTALAGGETVGWCLATVALATWVAVLPHALAARARIPGGLRLLLVVATEGVAVAAATLGHRSGQRWAAGVAAVLVVVGMALYGVVVAEIDWRAELRHGRGDQWILGGAAAISAVAAATVARAGVLHGLAIVAADVAAAVAAACLLALVASELGRRRPSYDERRWATVFPLGMYSVAGFSLAAVQDAGAARAFAEVWVWVAFAVWCLVAAGAARHAVRARRTR